MDRKNDESLIEHTFTALVEHNQRRHSRRYRGTILHFWQTAVEALFARTPRRHRRRGLRIMMWSVTLVGMLPES